jgi:aminomethyltransferase
MSAGSETHADAAAPALKRTALHAWHLRHQARMGPFAGYDMPIRYSEGTIAEHQHTRQHVGLFDVSHMGVAELQAASGSFADVAAALERFVPCDVDALQPGRQRYTQLLTPDGGIVDDLMISRTLDDPHRLTIVSNAGRKAEVFSLLEAELPSGVFLHVHSDRSLLAIQGPESERVLSRIADEPAVLESMAFMAVRRLSLLGRPVTASRSGYTGEDGFELVCGPDDVEAIADALVAMPEVRPIGLGARDTLRLEAGLCLYGADIDTSTSPVEAGLTWSIQKRRREALGFRGEQRISVELAQGPARRLVGLVVVGKAPVRDHALLFADSDSVEPIGTVTSGGFSPTLGRPIAMGYVSPTLAAPGTVLLAEVRGSRLPVEVSPIPFVAHTYKR